MHQVHDCFGDVATFLRGEPSLPAATRQKLVAVLNDDAQCRKLKMELAVTVDGMEPFVKATCALEGDGMLSVTAYERIRTLYSHITTNHHPNVTALAMQLANGNNAN